MILRLSYRPLLFQPLLCSEAPGTGLRGLRGRSPKHRFASILVNTFFFPLHSAQLCQAKLVVLTSIFFIHSSV